MSTLEPTTPIQYLKGVGPKLAQVFQRKSVYTAWDFLFYLPIKYIDRRELHTIRALPIEKAQSCLVTVQDITVRPMRNRRKMLEMTVSDSTGVAKITFFQFNETYLKRRYPEGKKIVVFGDVKVYKGQKSFVHPEIDDWDDFSEDDASGKILPFYSLTEGLYQKTVRKIFKQNLESLLTIVEDSPLTVRETGDVQIPLKEAFRFVHEPPSDVDVDELNCRTSPYHQRIIYDEFFYLQLGLLSKRFQYAKKQAEKLQLNVELYRSALSQLPFELTDDQKTVLEEIREDFESGKPMNRMIQGDVGSGKTIVAFLASVMMIGSGKQVALMAPTEILAEQHFKNLFPYEEKLDFQIELLTGSTKTKKRDQILYDLEQSKTKLIIGTHALITEDVLFDDLGLVIVDEQHRFGVKQRAQLKNKSKFKDGNKTPHVLIMSATPIPRTLSMCVYGDMDMSLIKNKPKGRQEIDTKVFREKKRQQMYRFIEDELTKGRQAYFIYPLVEESEKLDLKDATLMHQALQNEFKNFKVGLLHGKMKAAEKEAVMQSFKNKDYAVLVSTTVVEVGVDVPNATIMVIEHAERFGLSQLHQLRGRVGRGSEKSHCFLMASYAQSEESQFRLKIMEQTNDGFVISEEDLRLRGPGEFLGTKQSGMPDFRLASIVRDGKLLKASKARAQKVLETDPDLIDPKHAVIKRVLIHRWGKRLDLSLI